MDTSSLSYVPYVPHGFIRLVADCIAFVYFFNSTKFLSDKKNIKRYKFLGLKLNDKDINKPILGEIFPIQTIHEKVGITLK